MSDSYYLCTMSKQQYKYNPKSLSFEETQKSVGKKVLRFVLLIAPSILVGLVLAIIFTGQFDSPRDKMYRSEMEQYKNELSRMNKDLDLLNNVMTDVEKRDEDMYRVAMHAKSFPEELRRMGIGGSDRYNYLSDLSNSDLLISTSKKIDILERRLSSQSLSFKELLELAKDKEKMLACLPAIQPVRNIELKRAISGFGYRIDPIYRTRRMHSGIDFTAKRGTEVYATGDGYVEEIENKRWGYGKSIIINHGYGYKTRYAHLSSFKIKKGQKIKRGELIGLIGSTGKSTGPHLHYEVVKDGVKVNPIGYFHSDLSPEQYEKMLEMSDNTYNSMD